MIIGIMLASVLLNIHFYASLSASVLKEHLSRWLSGRCICAERFRRSFSVSVMDNLHDFCVMTYCCKLYLFVIYDLLEGLCRCILTTS